MNSCCEHLFREAKRQIEIRDKRIIELQSECTRLFDPTREFWNKENHKRIENLIKENEVLFKKTVELEAENNRLQNYVISGYEQGIEELKKEIDNLKLEYDKLTEWASEYKAENAKLRKCVEFYAHGYAIEIDDSCNAYFDNGHIRLSSGKRARQVLKELGEK